MSENLLLDLLFSTVMVIYVSHLIQVRVNEKKRKALISQHGPDTPNHNLYIKIYTPQFLIVMIIIASTFILNLAYDVFRSIIGHGFVGVTVAIFAVEFFSSLVALYFLYALFKKK